ncbi:hypothetical protein ACQCLI_12620 [Pseudomonas nitroreducens]|uniref:hypothetical protein n=1 Tax=Pseudomonas nitroreducens TaxID=46680 RepID=UPI003CFE5606
MFIQRVSYRIEGRMVVVVVPKQLENEFKSFLPNWKKSGYIGCIDVAKTKANIEKVEIFIEKSNKVIDAILALDELAATDAEIQALEESLEAIKRYTAAKIASKQDHEAKLEKINSLKAKLEEANAEYVRVVNEEQAAARSVDEKVNDAIKTFNIDHLIGALINTRKLKETSSNRSRFVDIKESIEDAHEKVLSTTGIDLRVLTRLTNEKYSKTTSSELFCIARDLHTDIGFAGLAETA